MKHAYIRILLLMCAGIPHLVPQFFFIGVALTMVKYAFQKMPNTSLYCSSQYSLTDEG